MEDITTTKKLEALEKERKQLILEIENEIRKKKQKVLDCWAKKNARFSIGDIVQKGDIALKVEKIIGTYSSNPGIGFYVTYYGPLLRKSLKLRKDGCCTSLSDSYKPDCMLTKIERKKK